MATDITSTDYYMFIESNKGPIKGESKDADYKDHIQVITFEFGIQGPDLDADKGTVAGQCTFNDVKVAIPTSIATAPLFAVCASGEVLKAVTIIGRKATGAKQKPYIQWRLHKAQVASITMDPTGDRPKDTVVFKYAKCELAYFRQNQDGSLEDAARQAGWDADLNKALTPTLPYTPPKPT